MHYELHGRMEPDAPTLVLSSGLGGSGASGRRSCRR